MWTLLVPFTILVQSIIEPFPHQQQRTGTLVFSHLIEHVFNWIRYSKLDLIEVADVCLCVFV